jgi:3-methyladenine DNA glycosylase AlkD
MQVIADQLEVRLRAFADAERAEGEKRYLKSDLQFLGVTMGQIRAAVKDAARGLPAVTHDELVMLVEALWAVPLFERRMAAILVLDRFAGLLRAADAPLVERLVRESRTWALVDPLSTDVLGGILGRDAEGISPVLDRWATDADFWIRRSSLLAELRPIRAGATLDRFLRRADPMLEEGEFFIRKAIGWVLREGGKRRPAEVTTWLAHRTHRSSGVTMREAVKYLPAGDQERLMNAHRERRAAA